MLGLLRRLFKKKWPLNYEDAKQLAVHDDAAVRAALAARADLKPELLYYLAEDREAQVRRRVASNDATPPQANLLLANDKDHRVRAELATKIARLVPGLSADEQERLNQQTLETLETLARDQATTVRVILADALKNVACVPASVILRLAQDAELVVAAPVLQFSPVLTDEDLLDIISTRPIPGALTAISQRRGVAVPVADAIAATDDIPAIAALLGNSSAQIREETLDRLVDRAASVEPWHAPLVERPHLPAKAATKLARFVADNLLRSLAERRDLDPDATAAVAAVVKKRIDEIGDDGLGRATVRRETEENAALIRARHLKSQGKLNESMLDAALSSGDHPFVVAALAVMAEQPLGVVRKTVETQSAKGMVALAWKAHLSMALCEQLQIRLLHLPLQRVLHHRNGSYPLTSDEMIWQLEFLAG